MSLRGAAALKDVDLAETRRRCGLRQATIAAALGVTPSCVSRWETRRLRPPESYARVIRGLLRHLEVEA